MSTFNDTSGAPRSSGTTGTRTGLLAGPTEDEPASTTGSADITDATARSSRSRPAATVLWRLRTTVQDEPGSLAALCAALAGREVDILSLQTHPLAEGTVDEFLLRVPATLAASDLSGTAAEVGGRDTWVERADTHDLVDAPTRVLGLATSTALDAAELPLALRRLLGRCAIHTLPAAAGPGQEGDAGSGTGTPVEGSLEGTVLWLRLPDGGMLTVERPYLPFTPTEFARARALVELDTRLGPRVPREHEAVTPRRGREITVRRAGTSDLALARDMHERCSTRTLRRRYHGPAGDADRYLTHLLSPRFGHTLAAQTDSGRIVALGHLLWDGEETELALLVEDEWQRRGVGGDLLRRLVSMAAETGRARAYAVTQASNTAMVAAMRGLGLPLDYEMEAGTLVVTAHLDAAPAGSPAAGVRPAEPIAQPANDRP